MPKLHFISIGGSIMHQLALAMQRAGYKVSGSDDAIFDPSRSILESAGLLPEMMGWSESNIDSSVDAVIVGMHARRENPELLKAQSLGIPIYSFPEWIYQFAQHKKRIVVAGSHGKTSITALLMHVLKSAEIQFDYLVGARLPGFDNSVSLSSDNDWMIIEGDEYLSSPIHPEPKILSYHPDITIITGIAWDHMNVFPTQENYVDQFRKYIDQLKENTSIIYYQNDKVLVELVANSVCEKIPYQSIEYKILNGRFVICHEGVTYPSALFGKHNMENIAAAFEVCQKLGVETGVFFKAVGEFTGAARRLQKYKDDGNVFVYNDFAHAPSKVTATVNAVKEKHYNQELIAVFELHTYSSQSEAFLPNYKASMDAADRAIILVDPHAFEIKQLDLLSAEMIKLAFNHKQMQVVYSKEALIDLIMGEKWHKKGILMMSSGNFGGLKMEELSLLIKGE